MPRSAITAAHEAEAYRLHNAGFRLSTIAAQLGYTPSVIGNAVVNYAARNGLPDPARRRSVSRAADYARRANISFDATAVAAATAGPTASSIIPTRTFGVEIEFRRPNYTLDPETIAQALRAAGINAHVEGYNHSTRPHWKLIHDASSDRELVSPVLSGTEGLRQVRTAMRVLRELNCKVTRSEGMHVHVYVGDTTPVNVANVYGFYAARQNAFDQLVSRPRRNSRWCTSINSADAARVMTYALRGLIRNVTNADRYVSCNLGAYGRQQTVEYRQHQGTLNGRKACDWIELMLAITQFTIDGNTSADVTVAGTLGALVGARVLGRRTAERLAAKAAGYGFPCSVTFAPAAAPEPEAEPVVVADDAPTSYAFDGCDCPICTQARTDAASGSARLVTA